MMGRSATGALTALVALIACAAGAATLPETRPAETVTAVRLGADSARLLDVSGLPYLDDGNPVLVPGEVITLQFTFTDDTLGAPHLVSIAKSDGAWLASRCLQKAVNEMNALAPKGSLPNATGITGCPEGTETAVDRLKNAPPGTMILTYVEDPNAVDMVLRIDHNLPQTVKYQMFIERLRPGPPSQDRVALTDTCPVPPNLMMIEHWPYALGRIVLTHFTFLMGADARAPCE